MAFGVVFFVLGVGVGYLQEMYYGMCGGELESPNCGGNYRLRA